MKKEYAYRDNSGCYVAFEYDGHVFALAWRNKVKNGEGCFTFCPISSDTEFTVQFATAEEATAAIKKVWLKLIYTQEWKVLENKNFNAFCVDKLKWKEWHEYQEVQRHKAPLAAIAVGNRVYKDTYSTALSDGNAWVFAAGAERLFGFPVRATHKIDQLLIAVSQYPDMKLFDTEEERTEWSLKYLEEYAAKPEPTPVAKEQEVVPVGSIIDPVEAWTADKQTYCCVACNGVLYLPTWGKGNRCSFKNDLGYKLQYADGSIITGQSTYRSLCKAVLDVKSPYTYVCYTQSREGYELFIKAHIPKEKQQELLKELPGVNMAEQEEEVVEVAPHTHTVTAVLPATALPNSTTELPPVGLTNVPQNSYIVHAFESQGTPKLRPVEIADEPEFACAAVVIGEKIFRSFPMDIIDQDEWKFLDVKTSQPLRMHQGIEYAEDLGSDITAPTLAGLIAAAEERGKELGFKVAKFTSEANYRRWIDDQWPKLKGTVTSVVVGAGINGSGLCSSPTETVRLTTDGPGSSWDVVDNNGMPHGVDAARKFLTLVTASPDSQPLTADSSIKTMKPGVTPQPSRNRIGKIAARPHEYVYDGPQQMGTTFVSRYRVDDEVWVRVSDKLVKMKVIDIYVSCKKWEVEYSYRLGNDTLTIHNRPAENQLYDTLFDLISAMTSISVEELIAAAKEVV